MSDRETLRLDFLKAAGLADADDERGLDLPECGAQRLEGIAEGNGQLA